MFKTSLIYFLVENGKEIHGQIMKEKVEQTNTDHVSITGE